MRTVFVPDVGHGLAAKFISIDDDIIQIDCGHKHDGDLAYQRGLRRLPPDVLFLSHFHIDHYSGLRAAPHTSQRIEQVYIPIVPETPERRRLLEATLALDQRAWGPRTGSLSGDLRHTLGRINRGSWRLQQVGQGDTVSIGNVRVDVLWPPRRLWPEATESLKAAVGAFDEALEEDEELRQITNAIQETEIVEPYLIDEEMETTPDEQGQSTGDHEALFRDRDLPEKTADAHNALRNVADRMSLVLGIDNRLLFLGDLKDADIGRLVGDVVGADRDRFYLIITPHHGTRDHTKLRNLRCDWAVSSVGSQYFGSIKTVYKDISDRHWVTHVNGDFRLPAPTRSPRPGFYSPAWR